jgi:hypothetical protein
MATRPPQDTNAPEWENLSWDFSGVTNPTYGYDIRWNLSSSASGKYTYMNLLNPSTNRSSGKIINYVYDYYTVTNYDFKVNIKFTVKIKVTNTDDANIDTAHILLKDKNGTTIIDDDTDSNGDFSDNIISYYQYFVSGNRYMTTVDNGPFTIEVSKIGYIPYNAKLDITSKYDRTIALKSFSELPAHKVTATKIKRKKITP